jgi:hypothetical protein
VLPPFSSGPWYQGVIFSDGSPSMYKGGGALVDAVNMYCPAPHLRAPWRSRPNVTRVGSFQLGSGSTRDGQCVFDHTRPDGTNDPLMFAGGKMYVWNGSISAPSVTDITPGAVTIATTGRIYCATFGGLLIVTDGVNTPWTYDPDTATATLIDLDGSGTAWTAFGPPVVYGGKVFFILATLGATTYRSRIVWSEEADPSIGYMQVTAGNTYTNFWTLTQTSSDPLICLAATNAALYYFRASSIGQITGLVNAAFATTATHDSVSQTIGSTAPATIVQVDEDIYFLDIQSRQWRIKNGALDPLWKAINAFGPDVDAGAPPAAVRVSAVMPTERLVLADFGNSTFASSGRRVWDADSGTFQGSWNFPFPITDAIGTLRSSDGLPFLFIIGSNDQFSGGANQGFVYRFRGSQEGESQFDDNLYSAFLQRYVKCVVGGDLEREQIITRVTAEVYNTAFEASVSYNILVAGNNTNFSNAATATTTGGFGYEADHVSIGFNVFGRWFAITISCSDKTVPEFRVNRMVAERIDAGVNVNGL